MNKVDMEVYHQMGGTYVVPTEVMNVLLDENDTLNKGIDELIKKYEEISDNVPKTSIYDSVELMRANNHNKYIIIEFIQDLKKLKGE